MATEMPRWIPRNIYLVFLRHMLTSKFFFLITCFSFSASFLLMHTYREDEFPVYKERMSELQNVAQDSRYAEIYRKKSRLPKDLKYILLWTPRDFAPFYYLGIGQRAFIQQNCSMVNCFVTTDRNFFGGDTTKFDAIAFNGRNLLSTKESQLPRTRSPQQKYIFFNTESSDNYPICSDIFDGFFNWTATYKLDSDFLFPYIILRNAEGEMIGPRINMKWLDNMDNVDEDLMYRVQNKSKAAAWFVSHCTSRSRRSELVSNLQKALDKYGYRVDVYGSCGRLKCPRYRAAECLDMLERDYFFYMSLENSFAEDYVTEKLLTAVQHDVIPIVYGGANYSRFLPPSSYLDARNHTPEELATIMHHLMQSPTDYLQYFRWKYHYTYHDPTAGEKICALCAALNNQTKVNTPTVYEDFRKWWNPNYTQRCRYVGFWNFI